MDREIGTASPSTCLADGAATRGATSRMATIGSVQNTFGMERVGAVSAIRKGATRDLLYAIVTAARDVSLAKLLAFERRPLRVLYTEGFCGGAVIPPG